MKCTPSNQIRILTYKRTHTGDPDEQGRFGINDCMGKVRDSDYDAVIGVGGVGKEAQSKEIDGKITWIGVNPTKEEIKGMRGSIVTFENFVLFDQNGPFLHELAPNLAKRIYEGRVRHLLKGYTPEEYEEAKELLRIAVVVNKENSSVKKKTYKGYKVVCVKKRKFNLKIYEMHATVARKNQGRKL
jgi:hypothetical protein